MSETAANVYDQVLYPSYPLPQADPRRLETLAVLHGLPAAPAQQCRVLEVGCGTGMNLLALAAFLPGSQFVGVDLAEQPIHIGQAKAADLGLDNLELHAQDIRRVDASWGPFDYILAHGVYSWVPEEVRAALFQLCQQCLSPHGVAYVSYNTLPGGHLRRMIRDMLLLHCSPAQAPEAKLSRARDLLHFLVHGISADDTQAQAVRAEAERTAHHVDALLFHDDLAEVNQPVYFHDFVAQARRYGLDYLVETDFNEGQELELPTEVAEQLAGLDRILHAQYLDFLKCRRFRQTLLCRQEAPRGVPVQAAVHKLWIGSDARATGEQVDLAADVEMEFLATTGSNMQSRDPAVKAAMTALEAEWPRYQTFPALVARAYEMLIDSGGAAVVEEELARVLLQGFATGLIELSVRPPYWDGLEARPESPLPCTSTLVRWQLSRGEPAVTTFLLRNIIIEDEETRQVLAACDGQNQPEEAATPQITRLARLSLLYPLPTA